MAFEPLHPKILDDGLGRPMPPEEQDRVRRSFSAVAAIVLILFGSLILRLWFLQLVEGEDLQQKSEHNRIRLQDLPPWRGMILDRRGQVLVANRPSSDLMAVMEDVQDIGLLAKRLHALLGLDARQAATQMEAARQSQQYWVRLRGDLSWDELALVLTYQRELPGVMIQITPKREYRHPGLACHALGYLAEITDPQLKSGLFPKYKMGDYVGKMGVEAAWERYLRGKRGYRRIEVDALGRELGQLDQVLPSQGSTVYLTLDLKLQEEAEACLQDKTGAIIALDPRNGKILAMASSPTFSPEAFERGLSTQDWQKITHDQSHPLENRVLKGQYPPGSTFKIVMAVAGLEEKVITPTTIINCSGALPFGNHVFHCWRKHGHGGVNFHRALVQSCDIYFYNVGRRLGIDRIAKWSKRFGLGQPSGLGLDKEMPGLVASSAWKKARFKDSWHEGETLSVSIGQGYNLTTPIQMAQVAAAIANGGFVYEPHLLEKVESPTGEIVYQDKPVLKSRLEASPETLAAVQQGLQGVVAEGTGRSAKLPNVEVAGKTGTSQIVALEKEKTRAKAGASYENHAWFVAYAPANGEAQIAMAVLVEHGGHGGSAAAPLAKRLLTVRFPQAQAAASPGE